LLESGFGAEELKEGGDFGHDRLERENGYVEGQGKQQGEKKRVMAFLGNGAAVADVVDSRRRISLRSDARCDYIGFAPTATANSP
jgi:hypothetical protein